MANSGQQISDYLAQRAEDLKASGYVPLPEPIYFKQPMPLSQKDQQQFGAPQAGIPDDWDYKTSLTNPQGKPLPANAKGWNPDGSPWYGANSAFGNWWNGAWGRITASEIAPAEETQDKWATALKIGQDANASKPQFTGSLSEYFNQGLEYLGKSVAVIGAGAAAIGSSLASAAPTTKTDESGKEIVSPSVFTYIGRAVSEGIQGLTTAIGEVAQETEQIRGGIAEISEATSIGEERSVLMQDMFPDEGLLAKFSWFPSFLYALDMPSFAQEIFQAVTAEGTLAEKAERFSQGYEAGRILYSHVSEPLLKAEYLRRFNAGENPFLLAEELQNPGRELAGQLIADPTNFIGLFTKPLRLGKWGLSAEQKFTQVASEFAPGIRLLSGSDEASDLSKITKMTELVGVIQEGTKKIGQRVAKFVGDYGITAGTQAGKRNYFSHVSGQLWHGMAAALKEANPATWVDKLVDVNRGLMMIHSDDAAEVAKGIAYLNGSGVPMDILLSPAATETGLLLRQLDPQDVLKLVNESAGDLGKLTAAFDKKVTSAAEKLIPELNKIDDLGARGTAFRLMNSALTSKPVRAVSSGMSFVYMGLSPGYAVRNLLSNTFHALIDTGFGTWIDEGRYLPLKDIDARIADWSGGAVPSHYKSGFAPVSAGAPSLDDAGKIKWDARALSAKWETQGSQRIVYHTYKKVVTQGIDALFRNEAAELLRRGASEADIATLKNAFLNFKGNAEAAVNFVRESRVNGYVDVSRNLEFLSPDMRAFLSEYDILDDFQKAIADLPDNATLQDAIAAQRNVQSQVSEFARKFDNEYLHPEMNGKGLDDMYDAAAAGLEGVVPDQMNDLFNRVRTVNERAIKDYLVPAIDGNTKLARNALGNDFVDAFLRENPKYKSLVEGRMLANAYEAGDALSNSRRAILARAQKDGNVARAWAELGMEGTPPAGLGLAEFRELAYTTFILPDRIRTWAKTRDALFGTAKEYLEALTKAADGVVFDQQSIDNAFTALGDAMTWDNAVIRNGRGYAVGEVRWKDEWLKNTDEVPAGATPLANRATDSGSTPSLAQAYSESMGGIDQNFKQIEAALNASWGTKRPVTDIDDALDYMQGVARSEMPKVRLKASETSRLARNFAFHDYGDRKNIDLALSMIYPYSFWYSRTYKNWLSRIATNAGTVAAYGKYKDYMAEIHAGLPDWWKYNINSDELLGISPENPLYLNLEATLNPLNGLTGTDFNDPYKRVNWFTSTLDDMSKLGPSTWTPFSIATAIGLYMQGEEEAAARWAGRLIPITATAEAVGVKYLGIDPFSPAVNQLTGTGLFSGGADPYTSDKTGLALAAMVNEGIITNEQAIDAAAERTGEIWTQAMARAINERAPGQIASFLFGVGFKGRTASDLTIADFQGKMAQLMNLRDTLSPDEFSDKMNTLHEQYPFMDALLIARKGSDERDTALAWNVLNRLPPGGSSIVQQAGLPRELQDKFYETKGDWTSWSETDRTRFMSAITDMRAILATPTAATRQEWNAAKDAYKAMVATLEEQFGVAISDKIDRFFQLKAVGEEESQAYLQANPDVEAALDFKAQAIVSNGLLSAYYGGIDQIVGYYTGIMYEQGERQFGANISEIEDAYWIQNGISVSAGRAYMRLHPELQRFWDFKDDYRENKMLPAVARLANSLPEGIPAQQRTDTTPNSLGQEGIAEALQPQPQSIPPEVVIDALGQSNLALVLDNINFGAVLPEVTRQRISQIAAQAGISEAELLQLISQSFQ